MLWHVGEYGRGELTEGRWDKGTRHFLASALLYSVAQRAELGSKVLKAAEYTRVGREGGPVSGGKMGMVAAPSLYLARAVVNIRTWLPCRLGFGTYRHCSSLHAARPAYGLQI